MILQIILGLSILNLLSNFACHLHIKKTILQVIRTKSKDVPREVIEKVEDDLNRRLRMLQTSNFAPKMINQKVRLINDNKED